MSPLFPAIAGSDAVPGSSGTEKAVRKRPGAIRSLEPTHPVAALGSAAQTLTEAHIRSEGCCDEQSPFVRLAQLGGKVLLLGTDFRTCTLLHGAEELARVPFIDFETRYPLRGRTAGRDYSMSIYCHSAPIPANFPSIEPVLRERAVWERVDQVIGFHHDRARVQPVVHFRDDLRPVIDPPEQRVLRHHERLPGVG